MKTSATLILLGILFLSACANDTRTANSAKDGADSLIIPVPKGWFKAGSNPENYIMGIEKGAGRNGGNAATIKSNTDKIEGFGTLMQDFLPDKYKGKKIKMSGYLKSQNVESWASFWLRVDGEKAGNSLSFDNMHDRPIKGTTNWTRYEIILDVPKEATNIAFGALLGGNGKIWFDDIMFEEDSSNTPTTGRSVSKEPQNLNFNN